MPNDKPPIQDSNHNGYLDGQDILQQLKAEEAPGSVRPAHSILEMTRMRTYARELSGLVHKGIISAASYTQRTKQMLELKLTKMADDLQAREQQGIPKETIIKAATDLAILNGQTQEEMQATIANTEHSYAFGQTFAKTFPKGVKIDTKDMPKIMKHLGQIATPATPPSRKEQEEAQKNLYKRS